MTKEEYQEQLRDHRWSIKRNKILARDGFKCSQCNCTDSLEVHHIYYIKGKRAWEYPNNALTTWCNECHNSWHKKHEIEIRDKSYSKKGKNYQPPKKKSHRKKNSKLRVEINKFQIPKKEFKTIWWEIRRLSSTERILYIKTIECKYKRKISK